MISKSNPDALLLTDGVPDVSPLRAGQAPPNASGDTAQAIEALASLTGVDGLAERTSLHEIQFLEVGRTPHTFPDLERPSTLRVFRSGLWGDNWFNCNELPEDWEIYGLSAAGACLASSEWNACSLSAT